MGKVFIFSEKWDRKDLPILTYKNGKITISRKFQHQKKPSIIYSESKTDSPISSIDEEPIIERSVLNNPYCAKCSSLPATKNNKRKHYTSSFRRNKWSKRIFT